MGEQQESQRPRRMTARKPLPRMPRRNIDPDLRRVATRTAFIARFIVLREGRRSRAHRAIEQLSWEIDATADDVSKLIRKAFSENGDRPGPIERDLRRAMEHAERSVDHFIDQYVGRSSLNFREALTDYERSNKLLFGENNENVPRAGGWRLPSTGNGPR